MISQARSKQNTSLVDNGAPKMSLMQKVMPKKPRTTLPSANQSLA